MLLREHLEELFRFRGFDARVMATLGALVDVLGAERVRDLLVDELLGDELKGVMERCSWSPAAKKVALARMCERAVQQLRGRQRSVVVACQQ